MKMVIFLIGFNNQLLCYNPSNKEWTNPRCRGSVPEPRAWQATTKHRNKVWVYGGGKVFGGRESVFDDLHELHLNSCTQSRVQVEICVQLDFVCQHNIQVRITPSGCKPMFTYRPNYHQVSKY